MGADRQRGILRRTDAGYDPHRRQEIHARRDGADHPRRLHRAGSHGLRGLHLSVRRQGTARLLSAHSVGAGHGDLLLSLVGHISDKAIWRRAVSVRRPLYPENHSLGEWFSGYKKGRPVRAFPCFSLIGTRAGCCPRGGHLRLAESTTTAWAAASFRSWRRRRGGSCWRSSSTDRSYCRDSS